MHRPQLEAELVLVHAQTFRHTNEYTGNPAMTQCHNDLSSEWQRTLMTQSFHCGSHSPVAVLRVCAGVCLYVFAV